MNPVLVAFAAVVILAVGVYIGISGLATQYAFNFSGSFAGQVVCAANKTVAAVGETVRFAVSGLPANTSYHWASDEGRTETVADGRFSVTYRTPGIKTAWAFYLSGSRWQQVRCSVEIR